MDDLYHIAEYLRLVPPRNSDGNAPGEDPTDKSVTDKTFLREAIIHQCERHPSQLQRLNAEPLYPTEAVLWDEKVIKNPFYWILKIIFQLVPYEHYDGKNILPLNKLNLQFLTIHDYLLRNFNLFRMESICTTFLF